MLFRIHDDVDDNRVTEAIHRLRSLGVLPGIEAWHIELSLDTRKGRIIIEDAIFADGASFEDFRRDERHEPVAPEMATISDWWLGNYSA
ncbi:Dabb family protein [Microbacterium aurantiacum]|uniref:Dabb family protein n=1 Tax=Microbacterium aurantiacum TaxID=162393 RepID=UPI0040373045